MTLRGAFAAVTLTLLALAGCESVSRDDYLQVFRDQKAAYDEVTEVLESVKDQESMAKAEKALAEKTAKFEPATKRAKALPPPTEEMRRRLAEEMQAIQRSHDRMFTEVQRVKGLPGGEEFLKRFEGKGISILPKTP